MMVKSTSIKGVFFGNYLPFKDDRGEFTRIFCDKKLKKFFPNRVKQSNLSFNKKKNTLRGFHYQVGPSAENKIIACLDGRLYDIVVDLRKNSKTYMKWISFYLSSKKKEFLVIPKGCANAFLTLKDKTLVIYFTDKYYNQLKEKGIKYDDKKFNFKWPKKPKIISKKDKSIKHY